MRESEMKILFPTEKLDALCFFMGKKELTVEQELKDYLDKTYDKVVPPHVREYVESRINQESPQGESPEQEVQEQQPEPQRGRQPRQTRRQREQAAEVAPVQEIQREDSASVDEESQGMSMSM